MGDLSVVMIQHHGTLVCESGQWITRNEHWTVNGHRFDHKPTDEEIEAAVASNNAATNRQASVKADLLLNHTHPHDGTYEWTLRDAVAIGDFMGSALNILAVIAFALYMIMMIGLAALVYWMVS